MLPAVEAVRTASAGQPSMPGSANDWFYQEANFRAIFQAQLQVAAQALVCNAAQVVGVWSLGVRTRRVRDLLPATT